jgi:hypothetical protein
MKKKTIIIILSVITLTSAILCACNNAFSRNNDQSTESTQATDSRDATIRELEAKIVALLQDQQQSAEKNKKELNALRAELEALKKEQSTDKATDATTDAPEDEEIFKYTIVNGMASITQINTDMKNIVIPYTLDGYKVYSIGSEALSSSTVESIVISTGIEKIDWFAFKNCTSLVSVSLPETVNSIGYGAFDNASSSFVIRCARDSFAHRYAQSYGITYDIS